LVMESAGGSAGLLAGYLVSPSHLSEMT